MMPCMPPCTITKVCENILVKCTSITSKKTDTAYRMFFPFFPVSQSGLAGDVCPDPGVPENGKRMGSAFQ